MTSIKCCRCKEVKEQSEFGSHKGYCRPCYNAWRRDWQKNNPELMARRRAAFKAADPDRLKKYDKKSYLKNREKRIAKSRRWNVENKEAFAAREAARRSIQKSATPQWADWDAIEDVYRTASIATKSTGTLHHVDHIVPLKSKVVCGLHVPWNLRVLKAEDNQSKGNRHWPDMP